MAMFFAVQKNIKNVSACFIQFALFSFIYKVNNLKWSLLIDCIISCNKSY